MDEGEYRPVVSGEVRWADNGQYCFFQPNPLPFDLELDDDTRERMSRLHLLLGRLDGKVSQLPPGEKDILTLAFTRKESILSSAIEGTGTTMADLYRSERIPERDPVKAADNREVVNYKKALEFGLARSESNGAITEQCMMEMHAILMEGVRGKDKTPGVYRDTQVFVGVPGDTVETARYVPMPPGNIQWAMDSWFEYVNGRKDDFLIRAALAHYQFETIHPFKDGNGRIGRLMIMLILCRCGVFEHPVLYLSEFFNRHRSDYIDALNGIREADRFAEWLNFFFTGLEVQAKSSMNLIDSLSAYRAEITAGEKNINAIRAMDMLFRNPFVRVADVAEETGLSIPAATRIVESLESRGILRETTRQKRNRLYVADRILKLLDD
ncbi:MAG: Fic family protein [Thermoplasmata archaeon]|nr:Fic family protein [Thermoplasmata archaeon]